MSGMTAETAVTPLTCTEYGDRVTPLQTVPVHEEPDSPFLQLMRVSAGYGHGPMLLVIGVIPPETLFGCWYRVEQEESIVAGLTLSQELEPVHWEELWARCMNTNVVHSLSDELLEHLLSLQPMGVMTKASGFLDILNGCEGKY